MNIIEQLEKEETARLLDGKKIPSFQPGDTVRVNVRIKEGDRERVQAYEGVCIGRQGSGRRRASRCARSASAKASSGSSR